MTIPTNKHYVGRDSFKDWAIIFVATCVISLVLIVIGVFSYENVDQSITDASGETASTTLPFDPVALKKAVKILDDRAANRESIVHSPIGVGDPSI